MQPPYVGPRLIIYPRIYLPFFVAAVSVQICPPGNGGVSANRALPVFLSSLIAVSAFCHDNRARTIFLHTSSSSHKSPDTITPHFSQAQVERFPGGHPAFPEFLSHRLLPQPTRGLNLDERDWPTPPHARIGNVDISRVHLRGVNPSRRRLRRETARNEPKITRGRVRRVRPTRFSLSLASLLSSSRSHSPKSVPHTTMIRDTTSLAGSGTLTAEETERAFLAVARERLYINTAVSRFRSHCLRYFS